MTSFHVKAGILVVAGIAVIAVMRTGKPKEHKTVVPVNQQFFATYPEDGTFTEQEQWLAGQTGKAFKLQVLMPRGSNGQIMWSSFGPSNFTTDVTSAGDAANLKPNGTYIISGTIVKISHDNIFRNVFELESTPVIATEE